MKLTWVVNQRKSGRPFTAAEIDRYELSFRVQGAPDFTPLAVQPAPADVEYIHDLTDLGDYEYQLVCHPKVGAASDPATVRVTIADLSAPVIATFTATV